MERTNRIKWYFADEGATIYEGKHVFSPRIDSLDDDPTGLYEFTARRTNERRYHAGRNDWDAHGLHVDGDAEDFQGQAPRAKYWIDGGPPPSNPCGLVQHLGQGIQVGNTERDMSIHRANGIELSAKLRTLPHYKHGIELATHTRRPWANGIELGCRIADPLAHTREGMEFGVTAYENQGNLIRLVEGIELANLERSFVGKPERLREGVELGYVEHSPRLKPERSKQGIELDCSAHHPSGDVETIMQGIELGCTVHKTPTAITRHKQGIELGCTVHKTPTAITRHKQGIELGCTVRVIETPPSAPALTCADAPILTPGMSITFDFDPSSQTYLKCAVSPGTTYHVSVVFNVGSHNNINIAGGTTCADANNDLGGVSDSAPCFDRAETVYTLWVLIINDASRGACNVTLTFGTGAC